MRLEIATLKRQRNVSFGTPLKLSKEFRVDILSKNMLVGKVLEIGVTK